MLLACALPSWGCRGEPRAQQEARREYRKALLAAEDRRQQRDDKRQAERVQDDQGALLASEQSVAGVVLPRGMVLRLAMQREWYYETRASLDALRAYFGPRLNTLEVIPGGADTVTYKGAIPRDTPGSERVDVRIGPLPNQRGKNEVNIRLAPAASPPNSEAEARLQMEEHLRYAD